MSRGVRRAIVPLFLFGSVGGSALDAIHTYSGTTVYAHEVGWKMAWWTPLIFGATGVATGLAPSLLEWVTKLPSGFNTHFRRVSLGFVFFTTLYLLSGYAPAGNPAKLVLLAIGAVFMLRSLAPTIAGLVIALSAAVIGPLVEIVLVACGAFRHLQPDFLGIPMWLPALYAAGATAFGAVGATLVERAAITPSSDA